MDRQTEIRVASQIKKTENGKEVIRTTIMLSVTLYQEYIYVKCTFLSCVPLCKCTFMSSVTLCQVYLYVSIPLCQVYLYLKCNLMSSVPLCQTFYVK